MNAIIVFTKNKKEKKKSEGNQGWAFTRAWAYSGMISVVTYAITKKTHNCDQILVTSPENDMLAP